MTDDLAQIEQLAGALLRRVEAGERRKMLRIMARSLQRRQSARIARQQDSNGQSYAPPQGTAGRTASAERGDQAASHVSQTAQRDEPQGWIGRYRGLGRLQRTRCADRARSPGRAGRHSISGR